MICGRAGGSTGQARCGLSTKSSFALTKYQWLEIEPAQQFFRVCQLNLHLQLTFAASCMNEQDADEAGLRCTRPNGGYRRITSAETIDSRRSRRARRTTRCAGLLPFKSKGTKPRKSARLARVPAAPSCYATGFLHACFFPGILGTCSNCPPSRSR